MSYALNYCDRLQWSRVAIISVVFLLHIILVAFLLVGPITLKSIPPDTMRAQSNVLILRLNIIPSKRTDSKLLHSAPRMRPLPQNRAKRKHIVAKMTPDAGSTPASIQQVPPDLNLNLNLKPTTPTGFAPGASRRPSPNYSGQNIRIPGSSQTVNGMPRFRMIDPQRQGIAGAIRFVGDIFGAANPHCLDVEAWRGMTQKERIASHLDISDEKIEAVAERYKCLAPLKPGDPLYYRNH